MVKIDIIFRLCTFALLNGNYPAKLCFMASTLKSLSVYRRNLMFTKLKDNQEYSDEVIVSQTHYHKQTSKPEKEIQYSQLGTPEHVVQYEYNDNGFLVKEEMYDGEGNVMSKRTFEADSQNRVMKEYGHYSDGTIDSIEFIYNDEGKLIEKIARDEEGAPESNETFEYEGDLLVRQTVVDAYGFLVRETLMEYDEDGLVEETIIRDLSEGIESRKEYDYNEKGLRTGYIVYNENDEPVERILLDYDDNGLLVKMVDENRRQKNTTIMEYDDTGEVVKQEEFDMHGKMINRVERRFDKQNRLLESKVFVDSPEHGVSYGYIMRNEYSFFDDDNQ